MCLNHSVFFMPATRRRTPKKKKTPAAAPAAHESKTEREKQIALWAGVIFFMAIVVFVWALNFKQTVSATAKAPDNTPGMALSDLVENLKATIAQTKAGISTLQEAAQTGANTADDAQTVEYLQKRLADMERRIELEKLLYRLNAQLKQAEGGGAEQ